MDPRVGRIKATQTLGGQKVKKEKKEIKLVNCEELLPGGAYENQNNNEAFSIERLLNIRHGGFGFLCPVEVE